MKNIKKIALFLVITLMAIVLVPTFASADSKSVSDEAQLKDAIEKADNNDVITLTDNIQLTAPLETTGKTFTINGAGHTISKAENFTNHDSNGSLITVGKDGKVTLESLTLTGSNKYAVQAYNGGHVILDKVKIENNKFGGVLVNAGTVEVIDLTLGKNGETKNNGIEISKGDSVSSEKNPKLVMNGKITTDEKENVVYIAENDKNLTTFDVENTENSEYKIFTEGNKVVITDSNNKVLFESNDNDKVTPTGEEFVKDITVTVKLNDETVTKELKEGTTLSREDLEKEIDLDKLGLSNYTLVDFYEDDKFETKFDFTKELKEDTTIYAKLEETKTSDDPKDEEPKDEEPIVDEDENTDDEKDTTPKTGVVNYLPLAISGIAILSVGALLFKSKELF